MVERIKNKKGFTIIEIMVVIALIGILASVLVPQFGGVKNTARNAGMLTNAKMVEAYVASIIDSYPDGAAIDDTAGVVDLKAALDAYFSANPLTDPYTGVEGTADLPNVVVEGTADTAADYHVGAAPADDAGTIYVALDDDTTAAYINGFDTNGNEILNTRRTVTR